jgi:hypothetical protein
MYETNETKSNSPRAHACIHPSRPSHSSPLKKSAGSEPKTTPSFCTNNVRQKQSEPKASPCRVLPSPKRAEPSQAHSNRSRRPPAPIPPFIRIFRVFRGQKNPKTPRHSAIPLKTLRHSTFFGATPQKAPPFRKMPAHIFKKNRTRGRTGALACRAGRLAQRSRA